MNIALHLGKVGLILVIVVEQIPFRSPRLVLKAQCQNTSQLSSPPIALLMPLD